MLKIIEKVSGNLLEKQTDGEPWVSKPFQFTELTKIPVELPDYESIFILSCWDTNCFIKMINSDGEFEVLEHLGTELVTDKEYILIRSRY
jgi:hypothetical protein